MVTTGQWFAVGFMILAAIAGAVCFVVAGGDCAGTEEGYRLNVWGALFWAAALAMGAWKF